MKYLLIAAVAFLLLSVLEVSFVRGLPPPLLYLPLVLVSGVYLYQHLRLVAGLWWIVGFGFFLDIVRLGVTPAETFHYALAALAVVFLGQRLFSNRSFYGIVGCSLCATVLLQLLHALWFFFFTFNATQPFPWINFLWFVLWQIILTIFLVSIFFFMPQKILLPLHNLLPISTRDGLKNS